MSRISFDIEKSRKAGKLIINDWFILKSFQSIFYFLIPLCLTGVLILNLYFKAVNDEPVAIPIMLLLVAIIISISIIRSTLKIKSLERIEGHSKEKNVALIKSIVEKNRWNVHSSSKQFTSIIFQWNELSTDWGKQMTIIYDDKDILVNCISFGLNSTPSPFHWLANKRKVDKLRKEFKKEIQTFHNNGYHASGH